MKLSTLLNILFVLVLCRTTMHTSNLQLPSSFDNLRFDGCLTVNNVSKFGKDFGNRFMSLPIAVMYPNSVSDVSMAVKHVFELGRRSELTVAARGHGHSLQGQAQAAGGLVISMESLRKIKVHADGEISAYADVSAGELWINVLKETLRHGLSPKSWTDYLHLTVGGTLSNAGISGQAFRHGPQVSNVMQLELVTGRGEVLTCSARENADLFFGALGGLGQFGIITQARIALEPAPKMVKWIRILYSDFASFTEDQEMLISTEKTFDYIEGFVIINKTGILNNWRSSFNPQDPVQASRFHSDGKTLYCLEMTKNFNRDDADAMNQEVVRLLSKLKYIPSTLFQTEVTYLEFLDRVHVSEMKLQSKGLWDIPHPWLNLLVPRSKIHIFAKEVFGSILTDSSNGPILIYPVNKSKWDNRTSVVIPDDEEVFYLVAFLSSAPSTTEHDNLERALRINNRILEFCKTSGLGVKQYLPHYTTQDEWKSHFGTRWALFLKRKLAYDPLAILAPGQKIFTRAGSTYAS